MLTQLKQLFQHQLQHNVTVNLLYEQQDGFAFSPQLHSFLHLHQAECRSLSLDEVEILIRGLLQEALAIFYQVNQFFYFSASHEEKLAQIYIQLWQKLLYLDVTDPQAWNLLAQEHRRNLCRWLLHSNAFAEKQYPKTEPTLSSTVVCAEYSPELQLQALHLNWRHCQEPILDIGCGTHGQLVQFFRAHRRKAYGIDRCTKAPFCSATDWFQFDFASRQWGTVISHLGFSNHFIHHHWRRDGNFVQYAQQYMKILQSLQSGGRFCYVPHLPFIEQYLSDQEYQLTIYDASIAQYQTTHIQKR